MKSTEDAPEMPTISRFYGISIRMYFDEKHQPHFHAYYGGQSALVRIADGMIQEGELPLRAQRLVLEWLRLNRAELLANWERARQSEPMKRIAPLK